MSPTVLTAIVLGFLGVSTFAAQPLTGEEQTFIKKAATSDQAEIQLSNIALERASTPEIKQFAQTMVTDHTKASSMLKPIAVDHGIVLPEKPGAETEEKTKRLEGQSGAAFDKTYIEIMVKDHQEMLHAFEAAAPKAKDSKIKEFISTVQPIVAHHLEMAKAIRQKEKTAG